MVQSGVSALEGGELGSGYTDENFPLAIDMIIKRVNYRLLTMRFAAGALFHFRFSCQRLHPTRDTRS